MDNKKFEIEASLLDVCHMILNAKGLRQKVLAKVLQECFVSRANAESREFPMNTYDLAIKLGSPQPYIWTAIRTLINTGILEHTRYQRCISFSETYEDFYNQVLNCEKTDSFSYFLVKVINNSL